MKYAVLWLCLLWGVQTASGAPLPNVNIQGTVVYDLQDRAVPLSRYAGKVVVIFHEDKDTGDKNRRLKDRLGKLWEQSQGKLLIVALCEVSKFDFWPARKYVKDALRKVQAEASEITVLLDWKGALAKHYRLAKGGSHALVLSPDGRVVIGRSGDLSGEEAGAIVAQVEALLQRPG